MELICHKDWRGNFGDDLNLPFFELLAPEYKKSHLNSKLYGIGTLLNNVHGKIENTIIFGSGYGYGETLEYDSNSTTIFGVRGPRTADKLGIDESFVIGDPAIYLPKIPKLNGGKKVSNNIVVALHHTTCELWDFKNVKSNKFTYLDPGLESLEDYISTIKSAEVVFTESLHGAIVAASYGIPFIPISIYTNLEKKKWLDFFNSIGILDFQFLKFDPPNTPQLRYLRTRGKIRKFIPCSKEGVSLSKEYIAKLENKLLKNSEDIDFYNSKPEIISNLQNNIKEAVIKFRNYCNKQANTAL